MNKNKQGKKYNLHGDTFMAFLKKIHGKFAKCYIFIDKASLP
jgi:hypothetical protein